MQVVSLQFQIHCICILYILYIVLEWIVISTDIDFSTQPTIVVIQVRAVSQIHVKYKLLVISLAIGPIFVLFFKNVQELGLVSKQRIMQQNHY